MAFVKKQGVTTDILQEKTNEVALLTRQANDAVDLVTRTISSLELINQQLDGAMQEIDEYTENLAKTRENMSKQRSHNSAIISNFSKLLSTEE
jgi:ABC-type transporter Mla subunit MlaD